MDRLVRDPRITGENNKFGTVTPQLMDFVIDYQAFDCAAIKEDVLFLTEIILQLLTDGMYQGGTDKECVEKMRRLEYIVRLIQSMEVKDNGQEQEQDDGLE